MSGMAFPEPTALADNLIEREEDHESTVYHKESGQNRMRAKQTTTPTITQAAGLTGIDSVSRD